MEIDRILLLSLLSDSIKANTCGYPHYRDGSMLRMPCEEKHPSGNILAVKTLLEKVDSRVL